MKNLHRLKIENYPELLYLGPPVSAGPLPALFYFALSAEDSLSLPPFNEPLLYFKECISKKQIRIFSITIPGHENNLRKEKALEYWANHIKNGIDPLSTFINDISSLINHLYETNILIKNKLIVAGLSRGGFIATLLAIKQSLCRHVLGFAPLTDLTSAKEFQGLINHPLIEYLNLKRQAHLLTHAKIRYYIGNRDLRVKTSNAFDLISFLANLAHEKRIKEGSFELIITNSIGLMGHGTSDKTFKEGAMWAYQELFPNE